MTDQPRMIEIDLHRGDRSSHPDFDPSRYYLAIWGGEPYFGQFHRVWFGWHFSCGFGASGGFQFNTPGYNHSLWERLWEVRLEDVR